MSQRGVIRQLSTEGLWTAEEEEEEEEGDLNFDCSIFYNVIFASQGGAHPTPLEAAFQNYEKINSKAFRNNAGGSESFLIKILFQFY